METGLYQLKGTERVETKTEEIPCGEMLTTSYFEGDTMVRRDIAVSVSQGWIMQAMAEGK